MNCQQLLKLKNNVKYKYLDDEIVNKINNYFMGSSTKNKKVSLSTILNLAIGQGEIKVTPLHVIQLINIIANNGVAKTPHINKNRQTLDEIRIYLSSDIVIQRHNLGLYNTSI